MTPIRCSPLRFRPCLSGFLRVLAVDRIVRVMGLCGLLVSTAAEAEEPLKEIALPPRTAGVQPMTGLVFWAGLPNVNRPGVQLEFAYLRYDEIATAPGRFDWTVLDRLLSAAAERRHQMVLRLHDSYPGRRSAVPRWIKEEPGYREEEVLSEGRPTTFPDWRSERWRRFVLEFIGALAKRVDQDPRLAFLEVGFGLWGEYHLYDPGEKVGENFPSKEFQAEFLREMARVFRETRWLISKDAHAASRTPFADQPALLHLPFGVFDDTFSRAWKPGYNRDGWDFFERERWHTGPAGGEQLVSSAAEAEALKRGWRAGVREFHLSFMLAEQWPKWIAQDALTAMAAECGYRFRVLRLAANSERAEVTVKNTGVAPIYYDAFPAINGVRSATSLRGLLPGEQRVYVVATGGEQLQLEIACDRLAPGQRVEFETGPTQ